MMISTSQDILFIVFATLASSLVLDSSQIKNQSLSMFSFSKMNWILKLS